MAVHHTTLICASESASVTVKPFQSWEQQDVGGCEWVVITQCSLSMSTTTMHKSPWISFTVTDMPLVHVDACSCNVCHRTKLIVMFHAGGWWETYRIIYRTHTTFNQSISMKNPYTPCKSFKWCESHITSEAACSLGIPLNFIPLPQHFSNFYFSNHFLT